MFICVSDWYRALDKNLFFDAPGDHADEMETSLLLYLVPQLVLPKEKWGKGKEKKNKIKAFSEDWVWAERKWSKISKDTGIGNPIAATKEKGEKYFMEVIQKMANLFYEVSKADLEDLYE
jgi:creatinine amidohydrolase